MRAIQEARLEIFDVDNDSVDSPDLIIPGTDISSVSASVRLSRRKDSATINLHNNAGQYTNNADIDLRSGQRLRFHLTTEGDIERWGQHTWGEGAWSGEHLRWTGIIRDITYSYNGPNSSSIQLKAEDFVFGLMSKRLLYDSYDEAPIAGSDDAVLNDALTQEIPEIRQAGIEDFTDQTTSITVDGTDLLEFSLSMARRANAIMYAKGERLNFEHLESKTPQFEVQGSDIGYFEVEVTDDGVVNEVRVDGGTNQAIDDEQAQQDSYTTVSKENRLQFQINTRKSKVSSLELWTNPTGSGENMTVRLQKDENGSPVAPEDNTSDIANKSLNQRFIEEGGFTEFIMNDHTLPEPNPWVIVETDGGTGQDVGVSSEGRPSYRAFYEYSVTVRQSDFDSQNDYRQRETRIEDSSLQTAQEAREVAREKLNHDSVPEDSINMPADSERTHHLHVGDVVEMNFPRERASGEYIVTERSDDYQDHTLSTTLKVQEVGSL